jgi:hypothetical protein
VIAGWLTLVGMVGVCVCAAGAHLARHKARRLYRPTGRPSQLGLGWLRFAVIPLACLLVADLVSVPRRGHATSATLIGIDLAMFAALESWYRVWSRRPARRRGVAR